MANRQNNPDLDETDRRLIEALRDNSRTPTATLAKRLAVSRGTVQNRIDRLLARGVLLGFTARLTGDVETGQVRAISSLAIHAGDIKPVVSALKRIPEISRIHSTNGRWDIVVEITAADLAALDRVLNAIQIVPAVTHLETSILLAEQR